MRECRQRLSLAIAICGFALNHAGSIRSERPAGSRHQAIDLALQGKASMRSVGSIAIGAS